MRGTEALPTEGGGKGVAPVLKAQDTGEAPPPPPIPAQLHSGSSGSVPESAAASRRPVLPSRLSFARGSAESGGGESARALGLSFFPFPLSSSLSGPLFGPLHIDKSFLSSRGPRKEKSVVFAYH